MERKCDKGESVESESESLAKSRGFRERPAAAASRFFFEKNQSLNLSRCSEDNLSLSLTLSAETMHQGVKRCMKTSSVKMLHRGFPLSQS